MIWRFRDYELDELRFELRHGGERVPIAPKPLAVLLHLAKRHPASVSHEELLRVLWPRVRVTRASLARAVLAARRALRNGRGDDGAIRTVRGRGYAFGDAYTPGVAPSAAGGPAVDAPFVGRAAELACIDAALDDAELGHGRVLCICGEPGIGKSRLLDELTVRARARDAVVAIGHCREDAGAPPYWPWSEILRGLRAQSDAPPVHDALEQVLSDLAPQRAGEARGDEAHTSLRDADARFRLFHDVTEALRAAAADRTLVILLEDLHWAAPGPLHVLRFAARPLARAPVLIALTYRNSGAPPNPVLEATVGELSSLQNAVPVLQLGGFSMDEIAAFVGHATGRPPDAELVRRLHDTAGGNPLFLRELLFTASAAGASGGTRERPPVPASVTHILRTQVARLSAPAREIIETAAVIGRTCAPALLARTSRRGLANVLERLSEAQAQNLVELDGGGHMRFRHDIIREALYEGVRPTRRIELHGRVARAIESGGGAESQLAELAYHFSAALPHTDPERAIHYATRAAEAARRAFDFDGAIVHYRQALRALDACPSDSAAARCDLLLGLGEVLELTGQLMASREAIAAAAALARGLRSYIRLGRAALAITAWQQVVLADPVAVQLVEDALRAVGRRRIALRAQLLAKLAVLRRAQGEDAQASRLLRDAHAMAKRLRDVALQCDVLVHQLQVVQWGVPGDHADRLALTQELLRLAERANSPYAILQCRRHRVALLLDAGAGAELDAEIDLFARASAAARCKEHYVAGFRAMRATVCGRFAEARRAVDEAEAFADPMSPEEYRFTPAGQRVLLGPDYYDSRAVAHALQEIIRDYPQVPVWRDARALVALDLGELDIARAVLEQRAAEDFSLLARDQSYVMALANLTIISWRLGEAAHARRLYELLLPHAGAQASSGVGMAYQGPVDWHLGILATMQRRRRVAARHFRVALATTERLGAWPWQARTQLAYASLLADGNAAERRRARTLAGLAAETVARFGIRSLRAEGERLSATLDRQRKRVAR